MKAHRYPDPVPGSKVAWLNPEDMSRIGIVAFHPVTLMHGNRSVRLRIQKISETYQTPSGCIMLPPKLFEDWKLKSADPVCLIVPPIIKLKVIIALAEAIDERWEHRCAIVMDHGGILPAFGEVVNPVNGCAMDVIPIPEDDHKRGTNTIRLTAYQRKLLLVDNGEEVYFFPSEPSCTKRNWIHGALARLSGLVLEQLVGKRTISLRVVKSMAIHEGTKFVRASREVMHILGVEDLDKVKLIFRGKTIDARIISFDSSNSNDLANTTTGKHSLEEADDGEIVRAEYYGYWADHVRIDRDSMENYIIQIPSTVRRELGVEPNEIIRVERDRGFLLWKHLNLLLIPILGTVLSAGQLLNHGQERLIVPITIVATPIILFLALSHERAKVR